MLRSSIIVAFALLTVAGGCRSSHRQRRPRVPPPAQVAEAEPAPAPTPPAPTPRAEPPRPATPPPKPAPVDRSTCGPGGSGPRFIVHGVASDDTLNVRVSPDAKADVVGQLPPTATGVIGLGRPQKVGASAWRKVRCGQVVGWVNDRFLDAQAEAPRKSVARRM